MNFSDFKNSFLNTIYHLENDIFCIFNSSEFSAKELSQLTLFAREHVSSGFLFQTSGTTSDKKFVLHDFVSVFTSCKAINNWIDVDPEDVFCAPISIYHMGGFSVLARSIVAGANHALILKDWNLSQFIEMAKDKNITVTSMVPSQIYEITQQNLKAPASIKTVFVGGSQLEESIYKKALQLKWPILKTFGSTEACSQIFSQKKEIDIHKPKESFYTKTEAEDESRELKLLPHWQAKLDENNRLWLKGLSLFKGYIFKKEDKFKFAPQAIDGHGFWGTDDYIEMKDQSLKKFLGRENEFIKINSYLVQMSALRQKFSDFILSQGLSAQKLFLISLKDLKSGNLLYAISESMNAKYFSLVQEWNQDCKPSERVKGLIVVDQIPKTELGKMKYSEIQKLIQI